MNEIRKQLIINAAILLKIRLSEDPDDYPKNFPKYKIREIHKHNEILRLTAIEIRECANNLNIV